MQDFNLKSSNPTVPQLNPDYVTGFSDGESSFMILFLKGKSGKYQVQPKFSIELHKKDRRVRSTRRSSPRRGCRSIIIKTNSRIF